MGSRPAARVSTAALLGAALLVACASPAPRDHFYKLEAAAPASPLSPPALRGTLEVERLRTDALTRERSILYVTDPDAVQVTPYSYHLWVDTPTVMLQREIAEFMRRAGVAERVVLPEMNVNETWSLNGWIDRLVHLRDDGSGRVIVELEFSLSRERRDELLVRKRYRVEEAVAQDDVESVARAFNVAVSEILDQLVSDIAAAAG